MGWLHTWAGVVFGAVLFAIFWMGTLTVFDREIDRWMQPETRLALPDEPLSWDAWWRAHPPAPGASSWSMGMPTEREPMVTVSSRPARAGRASRSFDPVSGAQLPPERSQAGSGFIYRFHADLHIRPQHLGYWIVGVAGVAMLVLCLSGVIIHRRLFADFFLLRPQSRAGRLSLDLHVVAGVLALPFHLLITFTGMVVFLSVFFLPQISGIVYGGERQAFTREWLDVFDRPKANVPAGGPMASLDAMAAEAQRRWNGSRPSSLVVNHPGDANAYVTITRPWANSVTRPLESLSFDAATGAVLHARVMAPPVRVYQFMSGFHLMRYDQWILRWLCFVLGLAGCLLIATGYLFWMESRRKVHERQGLAGVRIVEGLTIGSTTGIIAATMAFFVANRLMPVDRDVFGVAPARLEIWVFYAVWLTTFAHAALRRARAWGEQCWIVAALASVAVALNAVTTGDHLVRTIGKGMWPVAGMDLMLMLCAAAAVATGRLLSPRRSERPATVAVRPPMAMADGRQG